MPNPKGRESLTVDAKLVRLARKRYPGLTKSRIGDLALLAFVTDEDVKILAAENRREILGRYKADIVLAAHDAFEAMLRELDGVS